MKVSGIYMIRNTQNGKVYIGSTAKTLSQRKAQHFSKMRHGKHENNYIQNAFDSGQVFEFNVIETDCENLIEREQFWIDWFDATNRDRGYNLRVHAESNLGFQKSIASRQAQSKLYKELGIKPPTLSGQDNGFFGKKHDEETRRKMSEAKKGKPTWSKGQTFSAEYRAKISTARQGTYNFFDPNGNTVTIVNMKKFCRENHLSSPAMFGVAKGKKESYRGWKLNSLGR